MKERDSALAERDEQVKSNSTLLSEREEARKQVKEVTAKQTGFSRMTKDLEAYTALGTLDEFRSAKARIAELPPPKDPAYKAMEERLAKMEQETAEAKKREEEAVASAKRERQTGKLRDVASAAGLRNDPMAQEALVLLVERRGMSEADDGTLQIGKGKDKKPAGEFIAALANDGASFLFGTSTGSGGGGEPGGTGGDTEDEDPVVRGAKVREQAQAEWKKIHGIP